MKSASLRHKKVIRFFPCVSYDGKVPVLQYFINGGRLLKLTSAKSNKDIDRL